MDFKEVCAFFNSSIFHEECRPIFKSTDFRSRLNGLHRPEDCTEEHIKFRTLILVSVFSILRGQTADAITVLEDAFKSTKDLQWKRRLSAYAKYAYTVQ